MKGTPEASLEFRETTLVFPLLLPKKQGNEGWGGGNGEKTRALLDFIGKRKQISETFAADSLWTLSDWAFPSCVRCLSRCVPACVAKTCAERPVFARVAGERRAADPRSCSNAAHEANASPGTHPDAPGRSSGAGISSGQSAHAESAQGVF